MGGLLRGLRAPARGAPRARFAGAAGLVLLGEAALCALLVAFVPCAPPPPSPTPPPPSPRLSPEVPRARTALSSLSPDPSYFYQGFTLKW